MGDPVGAGVDFGVAQRLPLEHQGHGIGPFGRMGFEAAEGKCMWTRCPQRQRRTLLRTSKWRKGVVPAPVGRCHITEQTLAFRTLPQQRQSLHFFFRQHRQLGQRMLAVCCQPLDQHFQCTLHITSN